MTISVQLKLLECVDPDLCCISDECKRQAHKNSGVLVERGRTAIARTVTCPAVLRTKV